MDRSRLEIRPGVWLDARRAVWFEAGRTLAVSDLHLGFAWVQRMRGQLLPLGPHDAEITRLEELITFYRPAEIILMGDIIHGPCPIPAVSETLAALFQRLGGSQVRLLRGNHDTALPGWLEQMPGGHILEEEASVGSYRLRHGDLPDPNARQDERDRNAPSPTVFIGHEHPAIVLRDELGSGAKVPCFLVSANLVVLPAFSEWAAGCVFGRDGFLSAYSRSTRFDQAVAIVAGKLLPLPLPGGVPEPG